MAVTLSIKDVPEGLAEALRQRARKNHRSIQGELMAILEQNVGGRPFRAFALLERIRELGVESSSAEAAAIVRETRDSR